MTRISPVDQGFNFAGSLILASPQALNTQKAIADEDKSPALWPRVHPTRQYALDGSSGDQLANMERAQIVRFLSPGACRDRYLSPWTAGVLDRLEEIWKAHRLAARMSRSRLERTAASPKGLRSDQSIGVLAAAQAPLLCVQ